ncbi:MAG TPA: elongation factor G [Vicinamibacterales bacterium]|nr:elongation factor G [Vicinamibacterales bacterium]
MKVFDTAGIRNVALVGHSGSGKTQLASALLFDADAVNRFGKVDDGTTVTDYDDEAIARKHTLSASLAHFEWQKVKVNLIDSPGMANFLSEARAALRATDAAVVVIDAVAGVEVSTEKVWALAEEFGLPRLIALNRIDRERASLERALESMRERLGRNCVPVQIPIGEEKDFAGVVDLLSMKALTFASDESGRMTEGPVPDVLSAAAQAAREALIEMVAEADDALMERFFEAGTLTQDELTQGLARAVRARRLYPVFCTSGVRNMGVQPLADALVALVPPPSERDVAGQTVAGEPATRAADDRLPLVLWVWKTVADPFAGRITIFRVVSGVLKADATVENVTRDGSERFGHLLVMQGKTQTHVPELRAGDIGAVAKLKDTHTSDTLGDANAGFRVPPIRFPEPVLAYAIEPKTRGDEDKIGTAMQRLREEDPSIGYGRDEQTHELLLSGQGQLHIEVTVAKLRRRFGVEVNLKPPRIAYRETITVRVEAHGRHKKQTGGHGQFGDCKIRMEPLARGADFEFANEIFGGAIPRQFVPAIEKGIQETRLRGYLAGYPVVDFKVVVYDGSYHDVDSNEMSFKMAGRLAFKDAMSRARPTLLEPIMNVEVSAPSEFAGDLMGDLNSRRGRIAGMDTRGVATIIKAIVPMAEMLTYEQTLTSTTGGRGSYHMEFSHYDEVPGHLHPKIIAASKAERGEVQEEEA